MSTSIHNSLPDKSKLIGHDVHAGNENGNNNHNSKNVDIATKSSILKYLTKCGLDTSDADFSLDDVDDSSMALLIQLSQQSADGDTNIDTDEQCCGKICDESNMKNDGEVEVEVETGVNTSPTSNNEDEMNTKTDLSVTEKVTAKDGSTNLKETTVSTTAEQTTSSSSLSATAGTLPTDEVNKIFNEVQRTDMENREYEQILAHYSLDAESFAKSKMTESSSTSPSTSTLPMSLSQNENLEPWIKTLYDKLEKQHEHLTKCQEQIQSVARLIAQDMVERRQVMDILKQNGNEPMSQGVGIDRGRPMTIGGVSHGLHHIPPMAVPNVSEQPLQNQQQERQPEQPQQQHQNQQSPLFTLLERFVTSLFHFPNLFITYIKSTFIVRVINLIQIEADNFRQGGALRNGVFLNWTLLMKLIFFSFFLFARFETYDDRLRREMTSTSGGTVSRKVRKELEALEFWANRRTLGLVCIVIIIYFVQTGAWKFLHQILIKDNVFRRVWKNEDLVNNDDAVNNNNENNNSPQRRGRRDRHPINHVDDNVNEANDDAAQGGGGDLNNGGNDNIVQGPVERVKGKLWAVLDYIKQQTFLGGQIDRPMNRNNGNNQVQVPREQILLDRVIDSVKDILYLFGSFFLSLFPMWHPRPREVEVAVNDDNQNNNDGGGNEEPQG